MKNSEFKSAVNSLRVKESDVILNRFYLHLECNPLETESQLDQAIGAISAICSIGLISKIHKDFLLNALFVQYYSNLN